MLENVDFYIKMIFIKYYYCAFENVGNGISETVESEIFQVITPLDPLDYERLRFDSRLKNPSHTPVFSYIGF